MNNNMAMVEYAPKTYSNLEGSYMRGLVGDDRMVHDGSINQVLKGFSHTFRASGFSLRVWSLEISKVFFNQGLHVCRVFVRVL